MDRRFPPSLVRLAATLFVVGLGASIYLEARAYDWLARHPITVNLISAFICLNAAIVALDRIVRMFATRERADELYKPVKQELKQLRSRYRPKNIAISFSGQVTRTNFTTMYQFTADVFAGNEPGQARAQFREALLRYLETLREFPSPDSPAAVGLRKVEERVVALSDPQASHESEAKQYVDIQADVDWLERSISDQHRRSASKQAAEELKGRASRI